MPVAGADTVGTGIATANDHHPLARRHSLPGQAITGIDLVLLR